MDPTTRPGLSVTLPNLTAAEAQDGPAGANSRAELTRIVLENLGPFTCALFERAGQSFLITDLEARILWANRAFQDLTGYTIDELTALSIDDLTPEPWRPFTTEKRQRLLTEGHPLRYEKAYRSKDGRSIPVDLVADVFRDPTGYPLGYYSFIADSTEQKRAEAALKASESRFRLLFDEAPFGYHEIDTEGNIIAINQTECAMLGYRREDLLGKPIFDLVAEDQRETARQAVREKVQGLRPLVPFERTYRQRDGKTLIVSIRERLSLDDEGRVLGLRTTVQDITEQKQMEAALIASERKARALFEGIDDVVFVHDLEGRILDANLATLPRLGYTREEFLQLNTRDLDVDDFAEGFQARLDHQLHEGHLTIEGRHRAKDGRIIPVDINTSTIQYEDQTAILAVVRDITERKALEDTRHQFAEAMATKHRELSESEARYRRLTEASLDAVVVADAEARITLFNSAAENIFGYEVKEVLDQPLSLILVGDSDLCCSPEGLLDDLKRDEPRLVGRTVELKGRRKNGEEFPLELSLNAVEHEGQPQFIGSIRDHTERHRMRAMLVQSEKLASIGLLSAGVAHEINNPLSYVANNLAVLERDLGGVLQLIDTYESAHDALALSAPYTLEQVQEIRDDLDWDYVRENLGRLVTRTREGVQRVANIVQNLRGLARTAPPKKEKVLLRDLIAGALEMIQGQIRRANIHIEVEAPPDLSKVPCVGNQMTQVFLNLLINAVQAIRATERTDGKIIIRLIESPQEQAVEIADNGTGISLEESAKIFDPFFTTKAVGEGTGLGLSISHGIVSGHGGRVEVESLPGQGSRFRIVLPKAS